MAKEFAAFLYTTGKTIALKIKRFYLRVDPEEARAREKFSVVVESPMRKSIMSVFNKKPVIEVVVRLKNIELKCRGQIMCIGPCHGGLQIDCITETELIRMYRISGMPK